ncbi:MAG TPA: gamma-glutamyltransferase [Burkholderiales bacterium]|nr:gamma-glutamyltransferase [Burkholderiales bacterium]
MTFASAPRSRLLWSSLRHAGAAVVFLFVFVVSAPAHGAREAIASAHPLATEAGMQILKQGGTAFDAAVAVAAALAVVEPYASGLGGGGFFLLHRARDGFETMIDAREVAPARAGPNTFIGADGKPDRKASLEGMRAAAIPGLPAGLAWLSEHYGKLALPTVLAPSIRLAREGFPADSRYLFVAGLRAELLRADARLARTFLEDGRPPKPGFLIRQPELAATLEALAAGGRDAFYRGAIAGRMVAAVQAGGGMWAAEDLAAYHVVEREPQRFTYRGASITCASLPSSGGLTLAESLQILERYPVPTLDPVQRTHLVVEALRRGYQDRARYLGDPDFVTVPKWLGTRAYADKRAADIDPERATPSDRLAAISEGDNTTHFSVVDAYGNRVAATLSINLPFGAGVVAGDTGVVLNDEMDDFTVAPGVPNAFGLTGGTANEVEARKRPLSSMTPAFVEDERGVLVLGTPGGSRIISMVLLAILDYVDGGNPDIDRLVSEPRYHHQYLPDEIEYEPNAFPAEWIDALRQRGYTMREGRRRWGNMQAVFVERASGEATAHSDPRGNAAAMF